jgi:DNA polymerase-1
MSTGPLDAVKLDLVNNMDTCGEFKTWLGEQHENDTLGFDTETTGLSPYKGDFVRLIQIGDTMHGWAFPPGWHGAALQALREYEGDWVAHNAKFDVNFLRHTFPGQFTPDWARIHDTMTLAHLEDPTRTRALKPLSAMLVDPRAAESQQVLDKEMNKNNWTWATVPIVESGEGMSYWVYGALDPVLTCRMLTHFLPVRAQYARAYELEMGTVRAIADMERRGAHVDLDYCAAKIEQINTYSAQMRGWIRQAHGIKNATSLAQCIARFEELGYEITGRTKSGRKQLDKDQLELLVALGGEGGQLAQAILDLRRGEKFVGPYFKHFIDDVDEAACVHPTIWPVGTRTARMSVQNPALQTLPRKDPTVRDAFIPREGNVLVAIDADQIELRLATHLSRDEGLKAAFESGADFFSTVASEAYGQVITKEDPRRQLMKNGIYATLYGAGIPKIAATSGVSVKAMETVMAHFHERYPGVHRLQREIESVAKRRGMSEGRPYVYTEAGRKMYGDTGREYALVNYAIQSSAAELLKQGICDCEAAGLGEFLILPVHDELVLDVPRGETEDVLHTLTETLNGVGKDYLVPITWGADVMEDRWGTKYRKK